MPKLTKWQILMLVVMHYMALQMLLRFTGPIITTVIVCLVAAMSVTIYLLRYDRPKAAHLYTKPVGRRWIELVCRASKQQPPEECTLSAAASSLQLQTEEDFEWCIERICEDVFGHDDAVAAVTRSVQKNVLLHGRSDTSARTRPLGIFLLVGAHGIGRRTLGAQLGPRLFAESTVTTIDLRDFSDDHGVARLIGSPGTDGALIAPLRSSPNHILVLENIEAAAAAVQKTLQEVLLRGQCSDGNHGGPISFRNAVVFLTSSAMADTAKTGLKREAVVEAFCSLTSCSTSLISLADECLLLETPDDQTKARVLLRMMQEECRTYQLSLDYVDPEIVVREVERYSEVCGFEYSRIRIARWISDPIHLAARHGMESLVLTTDLVDQENSGFIPTEETLQTSSV